MKYITFLLLFFCDSIIIAQNLSGHIEYSFETNLFGIKLVRPAHLYFSNDSSIFIHSQGQKGRIFKTSDGEDWDRKTPTSLDGWYQDSIGCIIFKDFKDKSLCIREFFEKTPYLTCEPKLNSLEWSIKAERKQINGFLSQKAVTYFRGRRYTAWFTLDIPIKHGPWKFHNLPGLILEVQDEEQQVKFLLTSLQIPFDTQNLIEMPQNGKKVDFETFKKADDIEFEKSQRKLMSSLGNRGASLTVTRTKNPIERQYEQ